MAKTWSVTLDHAAVAVREPEKLKRVLFILGLADSGTEPVPSQGIVTHFLKAKPGEPLIEILEVVDSQGVVAKYLDKKGPGIHHLSFKVNEGLDDLCNELRKQSIRLVYDTPKPGAHQMKVNFIHPESTGGILIEIAEKAVK